jgi:hypothetical protein
MHLHTAAIGFLKQFSMKKLIVSFKLIFQVKINKVP